MNAEQKASQLINWGYRKTSNNHRLIARIDRPDWYRVMAQKHAPWDPDGEGMHWVISMGLSSSGDYYRRCISLDFKTVTPAILNYIPSSSGARVGYCRKKDEPTSYDVCKGPISCNRNEEVFQHMDRVIRHRLDNKEVIVYNILEEFEMTTKNNITDPIELQGRYKVHTMKVVTGCTVSSNSTFHDDFDSALAKAKSIVKRNPEVQVVLLKCTHVVQAIGPPVEVVDLELMEHSDT